MSDFVLTIAIVTLFRTVMVLVGVSFAYLGYKLFCRGIYDKAGDMEATWGKNKLLLKQAAPGTFFALFGVIVIAISIWKGTGLESKKVSMVPGTINAISSSIDERAITLHLMLDGKKVIYESEWGNIEKSILHNFLLRSTEYGLSNREIHELWDDIIVPLLDMEPGRERANEFRAAIKYMFEGLKGRQNINNNEQKTEETMIKGEGDLGIGDHGY